MRLVVDDATLAPAAAAAAPSAATAPAAAAPAKPDVDGPEDLDDLEGGTVADTESIVAARVFDAFPGATEVRS